MLRELTFKLDQLMQAGQFGFTAGMLKGSLAEGRKKQ